MTVDVLVVCVGNVCRSPVAERLLVARAAGLDLSVASAGTRAVVGSPMDPSAAAELRRLGGRPDDFAARALTEAMVNDAVVVLTATKGVRRAVVDLAPGALGRTFTLLELAALGELAVPEIPGWAGLVAWAAGRRSLVRQRDLDVPDPIGASSERHRMVADLISDGVDRLLVAVGGD